MLTDPWVRDLYHARDRAADGAAGAIRKAEAIRAARAGFHVCERRADLHAEAEAARDRGALPGRDRAALRGCGRAAAARAGERERCDARNARTARYNATRREFDDDQLVIAGRAFNSRLIVGTGKYRSFQEMARAHEASGADMVTVAVRRVNLTDRIEGIAARLHRPRKDFHPAEHGGMLFGGRSGARRRGWGAKWGFRNG